jgi:hypothetical protein
MFLVCLIPIGLIAKIYELPGNQFISNKLTGALYVLFWSGFTAFLFPRIKNQIICTTVLLVTCLIEFMQLFSSPFLEYVRTSFVGRALIGNSFSWSDFIYYLIGALLAWFFLVRINKFYDIE